MCARTHTESFGDHEEPAKPLRIRPNGVATLLLTRLDTHSYGFHTRVLYVGQST